MVFESIVVDLINKYLGDYVGKLDKSQLKLGLLGGNAILENLDIKENCLDEFNLPIKVLQGHINKLTLKIPWKQIYAAPVIAELDGLYILVVPNSEIKYDHEKEMVYKQEAKQKELARIEENKLKRHEPKKEVEVKDTFGEKLAAQIVKNLQINISNIHIRYEDTSTTPGHPFTIGITLANLSFQTCDDKGAEIVIKDNNVKEFYKSVKMDSLAVYWNSNSKIFNGLNLSTLKATMKKNICSSGNQPTDFSYLIEPISCSAMMHIHMKPELTKFTVPRVFLNMSLDQIGFAFTRSQYCDAANILDSIDRMWTKNRFRKYRPNAPISNIKAWWHFPFEVIMEEQVRRNSRMWSWKYIKAHRQKCHIYMDLWERKYLDKKLTTAEQKQIEICEKELDLLNITLCRKQAEMKAKIIKKKLEQKKADSGGWLGGWFKKPDTKPGSKDASDDLQNKLRNEFTPEEKAKLYEAIGYSEHANESEIPKEYVSLILNIELKRLTLLLSDESLKEPKLMRMAIYSMSSHVEQRSSADAVKVKLSMNKLEVTGSKYEGEPIPTLVSTQCITESVNLLNIDFETNPLDQSANQKIYISAEPLEIIYNAETINRIVKFITPPEELKLYELSNQVMASIEEVKVMTATGLRHLADQRMYTDINVNIKPSYFIMPEKGQFKTNCKMLLLDLGSISILSERTDVPTSPNLDVILKNGKLDYNSFRETAYDKFRFRLSTIQLLMIDRNDDWRKLRLQKSSPNHILKPFGLDFSLKKCIITNDINLPKFLIRGCLPHLGVSISNRILQSVLELILHVPFPQIAPPKEVMTTEEILKDFSDNSFIKPDYMMTTSNQIMYAIPDSDTVSLTSTIDIDDDEFGEALDSVETDSQNKKRKEKKQPKVPNIIELDAVFEINMMQLEVFEEYSKGVGHQTWETRQILDLVINRVGATLIMKRFDIRVQAYIGSLAFAVPQIIDPNSNLPIYIAQTKKSHDGNDLLFVNLVIAEKTSPDFLTVHQNTRHSLKCDFKTLEVCLHQEALFVLLNFMNSLISVLNPVESPQPQDWSAAIGDTDGIERKAETERNKLEDKKKGLPDTSVLGVISSRIESSSDKKSFRIKAETEAEKMGQRIYIPETSMTQWAITASLEQLRVTIASVKDNNLIDVSVHGMRADIRVSYYTTEININVHDMRIRDPNPDAIYKEIIWIDEDESIFSLQVTIFNQGSSIPGNELDLTKIDHTINMEIGKIKIVFLYGYVMRIQAFFESFQESLSVIINKAQQYSEVAATKITNVLEEPPSTRTFINIIIHAPVIYMPENSKSFNALMIDLGSLSFTNEFVLDPLATSVLEKSTITLDNLRVSRSLLMETHVNHEKGLLYPININLTMVRNLSWNLTSKIPQIDIKAKMKSISVGISQSDYYMLNLILQSNLGEAASPQIKPTEQQVDFNTKMETDKPDGIQNVTRNQSDVELVKVKFAFEMEYLNIELYKGDLEPKDWAKTISADMYLTRMKCESLVIEGNLQNNNAMILSARLSNINVQDTQPSSAGKITELVRNRINETKDFVSVKLIKDMNGNVQLFADVAGIYMCISLEYLLLLSNFFIMPDSTTTIAKIEKESDTVKQYPKKPANPIVEPRPVKLEIDIKVERPEILLVESLSDFDCKAIMLQARLILKFAMMNECDILDAQVSDFYAVYCPFREEKRRKNTMDIIAPTNLGFYCNKPINDGMQGCITMEHLIINITPSVIQSLSKIINSLQPENAENASSKHKLSLNGSKSFDSDSFWEMHKFDESEFPFISKALIERQKMKSGDSDFEMATDISDIMDHQPRRADKKDTILDKLFLRLPDIKIIFESQVAKKCIPMLLIECGVDGDIKNPATNLCLDITVSLAVSYFNDHINVWEPLIEVYPDENNRQYSFQLQYVTSDEPPMFEDEDADIINIEQPAISISITSRDSLEMTLSKTALDILTNLGKTFEDAYALQLGEHRSAVGSPYVFKNTSGKDIVIYLTEDFDLKPCNMNEKYALLIKANEEINLKDAKLEKTLITEEKQAKLVQFRYADSSQKESLSIDKSEARALSLASQDLTIKNGLTEESMKNLVVSTTAYLGMKTVDMRSILQICNNTEDSLSLYYRPRDSVENSDNYLFIEQIAPSKCYNVPIPVVIESNGYVYISVKDFNTEISTTGALWNDVKNGSNLPFQILECKSDSGVSYYYSATLLTVDVPVGYALHETKMHTYKIDFQIPIALHNQLPINLNYQTQIFSTNIRPGCHELVRTASISSKSTLKISFEYQSKEWFGTLEIGPKMDEFCIINFKAKDGFNEILMDLGVHIQNKNGQTSATIYSPYWMINKTDHTLTYKASDEYQIEHKNNNKDAVFFSFLSKSIFSKKKETLSNTIEKAHLKIDDSSWSDKFSLDTVGSSGKIICKKKNFNYEVGVKINLSSSGLTKIVTFLPYYMILNQSSINIYCNEEVDIDNWITVPPGEAVPFWPKSEVGKSMMMRCKVADKDMLITQAFPFYESHSILMKLEAKYIGIFVEVEITEEANLINLQLYQDSMALVKLVNHLGDNVDIHYKQHGTDQEYTLPTNSMIMYAWYDGRQKRELIWRVDSVKKKEYSNPLTTDGIGDFFINEMKAYWVSFVWESHRILLFTNDTQVAKYARLSADIETIELDIIISLHSMGLSLVNNSLRQEFTYISITSSGIKWNQINKKNRHKPLKYAQSEALEIAFEDYTNKMKTGAAVQDHIIKVEGLEVDLSQKLMIKPEKCRLIRNFEPGVFLQYRTSSHQNHIHVRIHRIQIDNQMWDCSFPVVFAPFPQPRPVALEAGLKPLIEFSAIIRRSGESDAVRLKYFRILIQEMQVMLDQGFVNSIIDFVSVTVTESDEETMFVNDNKLIHSTLIETSTIGAILKGGKRYVFDNFHISPIKVHLSFSLSRSNRSDKTELHSEVLNLFLQSVGIVITDVQDVIFKLGYFEKQNSIMSTTQITSAISSHYISQALRQMYVLVLGLDVLGNPFGVIRGMVQGVEDLFYEPVRGAVLGPEEFADGVVYGVRSLFGHAVGGAAGAVSRIVGTMGKGIAALTLDDEYQRKRREQLSKRPENIGVGLAQGGKGLIFGIVQGVTGVVTKPIDGAKKEGVEGFFKGVGKGLVGVVTRPVSGVVDFASSSFEGIRRVADPNIETGRIRPPRYIAKDGVIRPYTIRKAEGNNIWNKIRDKSNCLPNESYVFHVYCKSRKSVILLTTERVFQLDRNDVLDIWSIQWQMAFGKLDGTPTHNEQKRVIVFTLKEKQKKLFSKDNITKEIEAEPEAIKAVINKIQKIQKTLDIRK